MNMSDNNPFSLMFGRPPYSIIKRQEQYQRIVSTFESNNPSTFAYVITGIRGSGKTVMLRELANDFAKKENWVVLDVNSQNNLVQDLSEKFLYEGKRIKLFLNWSLTINAQLFTLQIGKEEKITNAEIIFETLLKKVNENNKKVLITIDEVTSTSETKRFANFYQAMIGKGYSLFLLMTGLKNNINALINSNASSFLSRVPKIDLEPLNEIEIAREYQKLLDISLPLAASLAKITNGYAFAYQVLGHIFYERNEKEINDKLLEEVDRYLQVNGYDVIWKDLTTQEKKLCFALAKSRAGGASEIMSLTKMKESNYQQYRNSLIEKGIILSAGYGKIDFALPRFKQFVDVIVYFG